MNSAIQVNNLEKTFSYYAKEVGVKNSIKNLFYRKKLLKTAVKDISFDIDKGEIVGFLGPNGTGKTSIIKMITNLWKPTSGTIELFGETVTPQLHIRRNFVLRKKCSTS